MTNKLKQRENYPILVIHSTDNSFGFGYRKNNNLKSDELFIKKIDKDLCNNLINDFNKFISQENLQNLKKISVNIVKDNNGNYKTDWDVQSCESFENEFGKWSKCNPGMELPV